MAKPGPDPNPRLVRFGKRIHCERSRARLSQRQLAALAQVSQREVSLFERGLREPGVLTVFDLARALHQTPSELVETLS